MPTGWRPDDVKLKFPVKKIINPYNQKKYNPYNSNNIIIFSWIEYLFASCMMFHLFVLFDTQSMNLNYLYGTYIFVHIFTYSSILDNESSFIVYELIKLFFFISLLLYQGLSWFGLDMIMTVLFSSYIIISILLSYFIKNNK